MLPSYVKDKTLADGVITVLPSRDKQGRHILLARPGTLVSSYTFNTSVLVKLTVSMIHLSFIDVFLSTKTYTF